MKSKPTRESEEQALMERARACGGWCDGPHSPSGPYSGAVKAATSIGRGDLLVIQRVIVGVLLLLYLVTSIMTLGLTWQAHKECFSQRHPRGRSRWGPWGAAFSGDITVISLSCLCYLDLIYVCGHSHGSSRHPCVFLSPSTRLKAPFCGMREAYRYLPSVRPWTLRTWPDS